MQSAYKKEIKENEHNSQVALYFADEPNPQVAAQVRQALLGACFPAKQ